MGVEIILNTFNNKVWLRTRMQSAHSVLYGLSTKTEQFINSFLVKYLLKKEHKAKVDLYQRLQAECVIPYQEKKRRKHMLIILRLSSESNEPKPIDHWSQGQCLFTTQSHWSPWNYQLNRLFRGFQNWTQYHPISYFYPKLTFNNSEHEFKKICMSYSSRDKNLILQIYKKKNLKYSQVIKKLKGLIFDFLWKVRLSNEKSRLFYWHFNSN